RLQALLQSAEQDTHRRPYSTISPPVFGPQAFRTIRMILGIFAGTLEVRKERNASRIIVPARVAGPPSPPASAGLRAVPPRASSAGHGPPRCRSAPAPEPLAERAGRPGNSAAAR